ncbi:unnamed protein product [Schistosoma mattheei]|uniref:Uncharacterized protein n=1 Tax=Schistosoma mattheei TaxID=31246 RepID=A0A183NW06_9TREM|nr:unnamed protein product [Schistosoma mattheei]
MIYNLGISIDPHEFDKLSLGVSCCSRSNDVIIVFNCGKQSFIPRSDALYNLGLIIEIASRLVSE